MAAILYDSSLPSASFTEKSGYLETYIYWSGAKPLRITYTIKTPTETEDVWRLYESVKNGKNQTIRSGSWHDISGRSISLIYYNFAPDAVAQIYIAVKIKTRNTFQEDLESVDLQELSVNYWESNDVEGGYPDNDYFDEMPALLSGTEETLPLWAFMQDNLVNQGYPYHRLIPDIVRLTINPVRQREYICVYDMLSLKVDFMKNGLAILNPITATIHEVLNGEYSLTLVHPIDEIGKWRYIRESNIIKCQGQLFTIKRVEWNYTSTKTGTVTAYCEHIFYQLNDTWIYPFDQTYPRFAYCISAMNAIMSQYVTLDPVGAYRYEYDWSSEIEWGGNNPWMLAIPEDGCTPVELLIGSGGILDQKGGELYRNNFHFSIQTRMENAEDNAFDIRFGENMVGFKRTIDTSTLALHLRMKDRINGMGVAVSYSNAGFPFFQFPHNVPRSKYIEYEPEWYAHEEISTEERFHRMYDDLFALYKNTSKPVICYEVTVKDLRNVYPELTDHYRFKVGNTGVVYDTLLMGAVTLKITETEIDGITGECTRIVIGSKNSFTRGAGYPLELNTQPAERTYELPIHDSRGKLLFDSREFQIMRRGTI